MSERAARAEREVHARAKPAKPSGPAASTIQDRLGNAGARRWLGDRVRAGTPREEREATAIADALVPEERRSRSLETTPEAARARLRGADGARVHRDQRADEAARAVGAVAFAYGKDVFLSRRAPAATTRAGQWLLAHELAHVAQQRDGELRVQRWDPNERFVDPDSRVLADFPMPGDTSDPLSDVPADQRVVVPAPNIPGQRGERDETYHIESAAIDLPTTISMYAIPRTSLSAVPPAASTASATSSTSLPDAAAVPGSTVYTPDGAAHVVLRSDPTFVVVETSTHFAVGAGTCVLVRTNGGYYLFDAGVNQTVSGAVADAVVQRIVERLNGERIRGVFVTHAHYDHVSLLTRLAERVQVDALVINPLQATRGVWRNIRTAMDAADARRRARLSAELEADAAQRLEWANRQDPHRTTDADWREEVRRRVEARYPRTRDMIVLPDSRGELHATATAPRDTAASAPRLSMEDILPEREGRLRGTVDPDLARSSLRSGNTDRMSTTFSLTVRGHRYAVLPDIRREDIMRIRQELRTLFGGEVTFQEWILGHHMQVGWAQVEIVNASDLQALLRVLHQGRARGTGGAPGRDVVITSVNPNRVNATQVRLLRALGFEVYLAHSPEDVRVYEIVSGGRTLHGVRGRPEGGPIGEAPIQRSQAAIDQATAEARTAQRRARATRDPAERARLEERVRTLREQIGEIRRLERAYLHALRGTDAAATEAARVALDGYLDGRGYGRIVTSSSHLTDTALVLIGERLGPEPAPGTPEAAQRARDVALLEAKAEVARLYEIARGAEGSARTGAYVDYYGALLEYQAQLRAARAAMESQPGVTRDMIDAQLRAVEGDIARLTPTQGEAHPSRLPDGTLVENRVVRVSEPAGAPRGPSPVARGMLNVLHGAGRVLGGVMVYSTITGSADLIARYQAGQTNGLSTALGAANRAANGWVGLRMLTGRPIPGGALTFGVISLFEVAEAATGDYDSESQRREAVDDAVRHGVVNVGCMVLGEALIATANPIGIVAGAAVMFLGPVILNWFFDEEPPEELLPEEVRAVDEPLARLLDEYRIVVGGLSLQWRGFEERRDIGLAADISSEARRSVRFHRLRALQLETQILGRFDAAYARARTGRAGLLELDRMRDEFLRIRERGASLTSEADATEMLTDFIETVAPDMDGQLRRLQELAEERLGVRIDLGIDAGELDAGRLAERVQRIPGNWRGLVNRAFGMELLVELDASGHAVDPRTRVMERFRAIETSLGTLTPEEVRGMEQWRSIRENAVQLIIELLREQPVDPDWAEISERQRGLEARLASARYRLDPGAGGIRTAPLLAPGTEARRVYEEELARAERFVEDAELIVLRSHWVNFRIEGIETRGIDAIGAGGRSVWGTEPGGRQLAVLEDALDLYDQTMHEIHLPAAIGSADDVYRDPAARRRYLHELETNRAFRKLLRRLEITETAATSTLRRAERVLAARATGPAMSSPNPTTPEGRLETLRERFRQATETRRVRNAFLFLHELQDLHHTAHWQAVDYYAPLLGARADERPLAAEEVAALETGGYGRTGAELLRSRVSIRNRLALVRDLRVPLPAAPGAPSATAVGLRRLDHASAPTMRLVGIVEEHGDETTVVPLNDAAVEALGGYANVRVSSRRLTPATEADVYE